VFGNRSCHLCLVTRDYLHHHVVFDFGVVLMFN
jgi:hypothetical protein